MSKYWNIYEILPYQRMFNFINAPRSIGKSYTTQKFMIDKAINKGIEFIYIVRTIKQLENGVFKDAFKKVINNEFGQYQIEFTNDTAYIINDDVKTIIGYCLALSDYTNNKLKSYPLVKYTMFDEYMLEADSTSRYVNGWREPELLINTIHTIDREENRVICFLLGNNTSFYNPYHMFKAFDIKPINPGEIYTNKICLYQWAIPSTELMEDKEKNIFLQSLMDTAYGKYAVSGEYIDDKVVFIEKRPPLSRHVFRFSYLDITYGVWKDNTTGKIYISNKYDPSSLHYALTTSDHTENTLLTKDKKATMLKWLASNYKIGNVKFESMEIKSRSIDAINKLL